MASKTFDTLLVANALKGAGFDDAQAEALVAAMGEAIGGGNLATKDDLAALEQRMMTQMKDLELRLTIRLGGIVLAAAGIVVALIKLLP